MAASEAKVFDVEIPIEQSDNRVKPGMSCQAEILIATIPDCLYVPVNCVFRQEGRDMCTVTSVGRMTSRSVTLGDTNDIYVQVTDGLKEGERVLLYSVAPSEVSVGASGSKAGKPAGAAARAAGAGDDARRRGRRTDGVVRLGWRASRPQAHGRRRPSYRLFRLRRRFQRRPDDGGTAQQGAPGMGGEGGGRRGGGRGMRRGGGEAARRRLKAAAVAPVGPMPGE